ncbi:MAG: AsmA family protein, partial [Desulfobacteraceae bacterium]|nr:AsmA family protein [Desulfobacteraceae bacterium]
MNLKKVLIIFAVSITLIFGGIVIFISSYDFSSKVTLITDIIYKQTGRKLQIKGEIDLKIGLSPSLVMEDIIFDNASWSDTPEMVKAEKFKVKLEIIPLFKRQIIVRQIVLIHPEIFIEKNQKGQFNFEFHPKDQAKAKSKNKKQINFKDIVLSDLLIENGKIVFFDAKTQEKQEIAIPKLTATVKDLNSRVEFNLKAEYGHLNLSAKGWAGSIAMILKKEPDYPFEVNAFINYSDLFVKGEILNIFKKEKPLIRLEI